MKIIIHWNCDADDSMNKWTELEQRGRRERGGAEVLLTNGSTSDWSNKKLVPGTRPLTYTPRWHHHHHFLRQVYPVPEVVGSVIPCVTHSVGFCFCPPPSSGDLWLPFPFPFQVRPIKLIELIHYRRFELNWFKLIENSFFSRVS